MPLTREFVVHHLVSLLVAQGKRGGKVGQGYKFSSVASRFKRQLAELMEALLKMEPHYIRCIKPNSRNKCAPPPILLFFCV